MDKEKALRFDDAVWNVSGLFVHDAAILYFFDLCKNCGIDIRIMVHGNIPCKWNSGRIIQSVDQEYQDWCFSEYKKRNIPVLLTFSNYLLGPDDLDDNLSNAILAKAAGTEGNGAIIASDLLRDYIHERYPDLILYSSILKIVSEEKKGDADNYMRLLDSFDRVVLHPDDGLDTDLLGQLQNRGRFEILINENCVRGCVFRKEHCDIVSSYYKERRDSRIMDELNAFKLKKCRSVQSPRQLELFLKGDIETCNFTKDELKRCYDAGYRYFKIQGRSLSTASLLYDLTDYTLTDKAARTVFKMIMDRIGSKTISENREILLANQKNWEEV